MTKANGPAPEAWWQPLGFYGVILLLAVLVYSPAMGGRPLWDDDGHITKPELQSVAGLWRIWTEPGASQQYYPLLHTAFWIEHRIWGDATLGYHLLNVLLHAASAILLVLVLRDLKIVGAELAGLIFALHPVAAESVAWISEQKNTLSIVFYLAAALWYLRWEDAQTIHRHQEVGGHQGRRRYYWATALFVCAVLSKSVTATLPAALLVVVWWRRGKLEKADFLPLIPWFALGIAAGVFTGWMERAVIGAEGMEYDLSFWERLLLATRAIWFYLEKAIWPANLMFVYPRWDVPVASATWWPYLLLTLAVTIALWFLRKRSRAPLAAWLFYGGTLFPALGFFNVYPFRFSYVADHFQYGALLGIATGAGASLAYIGRRFSRSAAVALAVVAALLLGAVTWRQVHVYTDPETLWRATVARNPSCWIAQNDLGQALLDAGRIDEALPAFEKALQLKPHEPQPENNLALALVAAGRTDEALTHYTQALQIEPNYAEARNNLGILLARLGRPAEGAEQLAVAVRLNPKDASERYNFGLTLNALGRSEEAMEQWRTATVLRPEYPEALNALGFALARTGRLDEAVGSYQKAVLLRPDFANAQENLGVAYLDLGRTREAAICFEKVLGLQPDNIGSRYNLALLRMRDSRWEDARKELERVVQLQPEFAEAHLSLATVLQRLGQAQQAADQQELGQRLKARGAPAR